MDLIRFLISRSRRSQRSVILLTVLSGLSSGLLLAVINTAADQASVGRVSLSVVAVFVLVLASFVISKRYALAESNAAAERAIRDIRVELSNKIRRSELLYLENIGKAEIYARLTQDTSTISQSMPIIFNGYQASIVILSGLLYLAMISLNAFVLTICFLALGSFVYTHQRKDTVRDLFAAIRKETEFFEALSHLVSGFKEIKINRAKNDAVFDRVRKVSDETEGLMTSVINRYVDHMIVTQALIYAMLAVLVFVLPSMEFSDPETVLKLTATILFMVGPLEIMMYAYHVYSKANVARQSVERLEAQLDAGVDRQAGEAAPDRALYAGFSRIELRQVTFRYPGTDHGFQIGPLSMTIERGRSTFIRGGNGCGKSTLVKVLTGLYPPQSGRIIIDGLDVPASAIAAYRELFTCIFSDFHLFDRLYGLDDVDARRVLDLIAEMGLAGKTGYEDGRFTNLDLSSGQRKRLALIASELEDKPIFVFDEWAADQDPEFRARFYETIVPALVAAGKTVVAVTHDDRYFDLCDQILQLDYGELVRPTVGAELTPAPGAS